jgi:hypothetical protein
MASFNATFQPTWVTNEAGINNDYGAQVAFNSAGCCPYHPDIQVWKRTLFGFWKTKECYRCKEEWDQRQREKAKQAALAARAARAAKPQNDDQRVADELLESFQALDPDNHGFVSFAKFRYVLVTEYGMDPSRFESDWSFLREIAPVVFYKKFVETMFPGACVE